MQGCIVGKNCLKLIAWIVAVSPHNMFVESAISAYDLIKSDDRSSLKRETLSDYMTIKLNMTPVTSVDLGPVVVGFLKDKGRCPQKNFNMKVVKKQEYYQGFFEESKLNSDTSCIHKYKIDLKPTF